MIRITLHGGFLAVGNMGILITGRPGIGKSTLAACLLNRGHSLVSDDATDIYRDENQLIGQSPPAIRGKLWINGEGIIDVQRRWGTSSIKIKRRLDVILHLLGTDTQELPKRTYIDQTIFSTPVPTFISHLEFTHLPAFIEDICCKKK